ncbi:hypothetical protein BC828DRAFT_384558, partial [Blastocladiella britannica]
MPGCVRPTGRGAVVVADVLVVVRGPVLAPVPARAAGPVVARGAAAVRGPEVGGKAGDPGADARPEEGSCCISWSTAASLSGPTSSVAVSNSCCCEIRPACMRLNSRLMVSRADGGIDARRPVLPELPPVTGAVGVTALADSAADMAADGGCCLAGGWDDDEDD